MVLTNIDMFFRAQHTALVSAHGAAIQHCLPFDGINGADAKIMGSRVSVAGGEPAFLLPLHVPFLRRSVLQGNSPAKL